MFSEVALTMGFTPERRRSSRPMRPPKSAAWPSTKGQAAQIARAQRRLVRGEVEAAAVAQCVGQAEDNVLVVKFAQLDLLRHLGKIGDGKVDIAIRQ